MGELNRDNIECQTDEEQPLVQPADNSAGEPDLNHAVNFLRDELAAGPVPGKDVYSAAESIGISKRTLERAKSQLSVITRRMGEQGKRGGGSRSWELPVALHRHDGDLNTALSEKDLHRQLSKLGDINQNHSCQSESAISVGSLNEDIAMVPKTGATVDRRESILGMPVNAAIKIWRSKGSPVFTSRQGEQLRDLDNLLSNPDCQERHLKVVRAWLDIVCAAD